MEMRPAPSFHQEIESVDVQRCAAAGRAGTGTRSAGGVSLIAAKVLKNSPAWRAWSSDRYREASGAS